MTAFALLAVAAGLAACGAGAHENGGPPRVELEAATAKEKLGEDDGFQAAIFYGAELMGSIDDCGCPGHPEGGLPWRLGYTEGFRAAYPEVGYLQLDAGHSLASIANVDGQLYPDQTTKNEWVVKAFDRFAFDAANISSNDIYYLSSLLREGVYTDAVAKSPVLARYVSANLAPTRPGLVAPPPYVVREMTGQRVPNGSLRVAIVGLTENNPMLEQHTGFRVTAPDQALEKVLPKARAESDLVVVLYWATPDAVQALAKRFAGQVDAYVVGNPRSRDAQPILGAPANIVFSRYQTRSLGELRLHFAGTKLESATNRYVTLDAQLPKDPVAEQMAADAKEAIRASQEERFKNGLPEGSGEGD
jgi:hypothetical protein